MLLNELVVDIRFIIPNIYISSLEPWIQLFSYSAPLPACQVQPQPWQPGPSRLSCCDRRAEARTAAANANDAPKVSAPDAGASKATDNSEFRTAAVNAPDAKKPPVRLTDDTSEKEMEAFKKPPGNLTADASENEPFKKPLPPGRLTGKNEGSRKGCDANFSNPNKNMANKEAGFIKSSRSDQDGFSSKNQTAAPSYTDTVTDR